MIWWEGRVKPEGEVTGYGCAGCNKVFPSRDALSEHIKERTR